MSVCVCVCVRVHVTVRVSPSPLLPSDSNALLSVRFRARSGETLHRARVFSSVTLLPASSLVLRVSWACAEVHHFLSFPSPSLHIKFSLLHLHPLKVPAPSPVISWSPEPTLAVGGQVWAGPVPERRVIMGIFGSALYRIGSVLQQVHARFGPVACASCVGLSVVALGGVENINGVGEVAESAVSGKPMPTARMTDWITGLRRQRPTSPQHPALRDAARGAKRYLAAAVPRQGSKGAELTRRQAAILAQCGAGIWPYFGFPQQLVSGSDTMACRRCAAHCSASVAVPLPLPVFML